LAFTYVIAFLDQQAFYRGRDRSVRLKVLNGFNLAVGGNKAADGAAFDGDRAHF